MGLAQLEGFRRQVLIRIIDGSNGVRSFIETSEVHVHLSMVFGREKLQKSLFCMCAILVWL
jgi:hypothetical protein